MKLRKASRSFQTLNFAKVGQTKEKKVIKKKFDLIEHLENVFEPVMQAQRKEHEAAEEKRAENIESKMTGRQEKIEEIKNGITDRKLTSREREIRISSPAFIKRGEMLRKIYAQKFLN